MSGRREYMIGFWLGGALVGFGAGFLAGFGFAVWSLA